MFRLFRVRGHSLAPDYQERDFVLTAKAPFPSGKIRAGDVILFDQPGYGKLIKRVSRVLNDGGAFEVRGTQMASTDSRNFGPVPADRVSGKVIWHIRRK
jgi:signal peptidase I